MFLYCPKCGLIKKSKDEHALCPVCSTEQIPVPSEYLTSSGNLFLSQKDRDLFIEEVIENNPVFDRELSAQRDEILIQKEQTHQQEVERKVQEYYANKPVHKCPVCGSTNLSAISTVGKVVKISLIGVWGAGDLGKKTRCNSCGHKF